MPWPTEQPLLADDRVALRAVSQSDTDTIYRACQDADIQRFTQVPVPYHHSDAVDFVALCDAWWHAARTANFAVCDRDTGRFVGVVGIIDADHSAHEAGVGYWTAAWGRGHGATTRAVRLATRWAFDAGGMTVLNAEAEVENLASMRVLANGGFTRLEGADRVIEHKGGLRTFSIWRATLTRR